MGKDDSEGVALLGATVAALYVQIFRVLNEQNDVADAQGTALKLVRLVMQTMVDGRDGGSELDAGMLALLNAKGPGA